VMDTDSNATIVDDAIAEADIILNLVNTLSDLEAVAECPRKAVLEKYIGLGSRGVRIGDYSRDLVRSEVFKSGWRNR
jgi:hypothetical protein